MASKYAAILPDIDTAPDVYESEDVHHDAARADDSDSESDLPGPSNGVAPAAQREDLVDARLDVAEARNKFKGKTAAGGDFSPALVPRRPIGSYPRTLPDAATYELLPRGYSTDTPRPNGPASAETAVERLRRLRLELDELETELSAAPSVGEGDRKPASSALLAQVRYLRHDATRLEPEAELVNGEGAAASTDGIARAKTMLSQLGQPTPLASEPVASGSGAPRHAAAEPSAAIDDRLATLERFVGASEANLDEAAAFPAPLITTLARVEHQLGLLTQPRHLDTVARRVKVLVSDLERIHDARRKLGDTRPLNVALASGMTVVAGGTGATVTTALPPPTSLASAPPSAALPADALQRIDALFAILPRVEPLLPLAPALAARLRSLSSLHASSSSFASTLEQATQDVDTLKTAERQLGAALDGVERSLAENERIVCENMSSLETRIEAVQARLSSL